MSNKISEKDKKDWKKFVESKEKIFNKDLLEKNLETNYNEKTIDLHGYSLENANNAIYNFINSCFSEGVDRITIITGKGNRSKNKNDPYKSDNYSILKYSVPDYIKSNTDLIKKIKKINIEDVEDASKGSFDIFLKKIKE